MTYSKIPLANIRWVALWFYPCTLYYVRPFSSKISMCIICLIFVLVWSIIRVSCTVSGPSIIMSTFYLRRHWLIPVLQNFRQRFFDLSVSDHGIVWFDSWSKCMMYCVPSLRSIIAGWDVLFFNLLLKSLIFSRKSWVFGHHI